MAGGVIVAHRKASVDFYCEECYYAHDNPEWIQCKYYLDEEVAMQFPKGFRCDYCGCDNDGKYIPMDN